MCNLPFATLVILISYLKIQSSKTRKFSVLRWVAGDIKILQNDTIFYSCIFSCWKPYFEVLDRGDTLDWNLIGLRELKKSKVKSRMELHSFQHFHLVLNWEQFHLFRLGLEWYSTLIWKQLHFWSYLGTRLMLKEIQTLKTFGTMEPKYRNLSLRLTND